MWSEGARVAPERPRGPAQGGGWRAGTTPSGRPRRGDAARANWVRGATALEGKAVGTLALYALRYGARESWWLPIVLGGRGGGHSDRPELGALLRASARIGELARRELQPGELGPDVGSARLQRKRRADRV